MLNVNTSLSATQRYARAPDTHKGNTATVRQVVPIRYCGTVYYLNPPSGPNLVGGAMPINVYSTAPMSVGGPEVVSAMSIAKPQSDPTAFTVHNLTQLLESSRN